MSVNLNLAAARCLAVVLSVLPPHTLENLAEGAAEVGMEAVRTDGAACSASVESNPKTGAACVFMPSARVCVGWDRVMLARRRQPSMHEAGRRVRSHQDPGGGSRDGKE